ncbi:tail fiber protein [Escherichia phage TL-2011c]|uniref:Carboxypeptidase regulatory-like domain-containing protein n=1 Tax=Escherichia phage TL-2011c TaxID=1124655 RepID=G9L6K9_9CAUD|nr:tail fiber protein [Escherichia phage TL-2011c]AEW24662.1 hypothetical protein [Escherichia phage TL-2011c]
MSVVVSGTLKSPDGEAISGANITLTALTVSPDALSGTSASAVTREGGYYGMTMDPGEYAVSVTVKGKTAVYGRVRIEGTESTVTLNMLLRYFQQTVPFVVVAAVRVQCEGFFQIRHCIGAR